MRLIDADELSKVKFHPLPYTHIVPADLLKAQTEAYERGWNDAIDAVIGLPSKQQWIPVTERLPEVRQWVLCQCRAGIQDVLRLTNDGDWKRFYPHTIYMKSFVVAWMPLPEPWEGGDADGT